MNIFKIKSIRQIEDILFTLYKYLPSLPSSISKKIVEVLPYLIAVFGIVCLFSALFPASYTLLRFQSENLFSINIIMFRVVYVILSILSFTSFLSLSLKKLKGWYMLFSISFMCMLIGLVLLDVFFIITALVLWYILFQIKTYYEI